MHLIGIMLEHGDILSQQGRDKNDVGHRGRDGSFISSLGGSFNETAGGEGIAFKSVDQLQMSKYTNDMVGCGVGNV